MKDIYIRLSFLGIMVILVSISLLTYSNLNNYIAEVKLVRHSKSVLSAVQTVLSSIKDAEIGHRGYQLTRDTTYLDPYLLSLKVLPAQIKTLDSLLISDDQQSKKTDTLNLLINNQFRIISQILSNARRSSMYMDQYESNLLAHGKDNMDEIRSLVGRITRGEENKINERISKETHYRNTAPVALLVYTLVALMGMTFLFVRILDAVSAQKKAEKDMLTAERLSVTGKMARTIAHEVRNPLTSLTLALEQLKDEIPQQTDSFKIYADIIERNANRIEQLIGDMLNSSKPRELTLELTSIEEVMEETLALTIDRLNLNQMKLEKNYEKELPRILLDKEKMKIAFLNILVNAVEAMEPGKGFLRINVKLKDGFVLVAISDNGKGVAAKDIEKLFDPFYTAKQGGMGLGLTSTKNILSSHSATIEVKSKINEGTTFYIFFKLA